LRVSRRGLLFSGVSLAAAEVSQADIVDTHVHFYDPFRPEGVPWPRKEEKILYRRVMPEDYQKLSKAKVIIVEASPLVEDNQWILDLARRHKFILGCVGNLDPSNVEFRRDLTRFAANAQFLGIRLSSGRAKENLEKLDPLVKANLSLDLIGNAEIYGIAARLSDRYPNLRIILDHLPLAQRETSIFELKGRPNVYAKVSWILRGPDDTVANHIEALDELWTIFGKDRVVYGTNWPVSDLIVPYDKVQEAALAYFRTKPLKKYLSQNAKKAYRWTA
jgi:L-fuconolactonase